MRLTSLIFGLTSLFIGNLNLVASDFDGIDLSQHQNEISDASKLTPYYEKIERELLKNGASGQSPQTFTQLAQKILDKFDESSSASFCLFETKSRKKYKKALELFISLGETVGKCDFESYKILAKNFIANKRSRSILSAVDAYYRMHAISCRPYYKEQYHQIVKTIDETTLDAINKIIKYFQIEHFFPKGNWIPSSINLLTVDDLNFAENDDAIDMLANRVAEQIKDHPISTGASVTVNDILEEHLYRPCKIYRTKLADVLTPARFDGQIRDEEQDEFINGDKEFKQAMINNRLCGALLNEQYKLYGPLYKRFKKLMNLVGVLLVPSK